MKIYIKSIFKLIKSNLSRFITIVLIVMLGIGFLVGLFSVAPDLQITASDFLSEQKTSEIYLRSSTGFFQEDVDYVKERYSTKGIKEIRATYEIDKYVSYNNQSYLAKLVYEDEHQSQDVYTLVEGRYPEVGKKEILVEQNGNYIKAPEINSKVLIDGTEYEVVGIVYNPWYIMKERYNSDELQASLEMVCYLPLSEIYDPTFVNEKKVFTNIYCYFGLEGNAFTDSFKNKVEELLNYLETSNDELLTIHKDNMWQKIKDEVALGMVESLLPGANVDEMKAKYYRGEDIDTNFGTFNYDSINELFTTSLKEQVDKAVEEFETNNSYDFYYFSRLDNLGFMLYDMYVDKVSDIALVFPIFFFIITSLVTLTSLRRLIQEERSTIGTLRGLGFSRTAVSMRYLVYGILASGIGSLLGIALGIALIPKVIYEAYKTTCHMPPLMITYNFMFVTLSVLAMILIIIVVILLTIRQSLNESPATLLIPKAPPAGRRIFLEKITFIWKHLKFKYKSTIRNMIRYKRNLVMMLIGVGGCAALVLVAFGLKNSIDAIGDRQFNEIIQYDALAKITDTKEIVTNEDILASDLIYYDEISKDIYTVKVFVADEKLNNYINFMTPNQKEFDFTANDVVISEQISKELKLKVGDKIAYNDNEYTITNINENYVDNYIFIGSNLLAVDSNYLIIKTTDLDEQEEAALASELIETGKIVSIQFVSSVSSAYITLVGNMNLIVIVVIMFAAILALVVIFNLMNINISERQREIATLKVLGYSTYEVHGYISRETFILTILGIGVGIGVGFGLHRFIASIIDTNGIMAGRHISWLSYVLTIVITLGFAIVVDLCFIPHYKKISMVESLKAIE